jgi:hypothetical protein
MRRLLGTLLIALFAIATSAQFADNQTPAYHAAPPAKGEKIPPIASAEQLKDMDLHYEYQERAYEAAAKVPRVLYQLPCYCYCDRSAGHKSLHSCFEGTHGANCGTCMAEALYAYQMKKKGWTVSQIRDGIMRHDYQQVDLQNPTPVL